ncbi:MAG: HemK family protein methyltransferase, partial [Chloroflexi bacterium]|nr:HemK family protein methyltransferase [Chloroflexota bacterium]
GVGGRGAGGGGQPEREVDRGGADRFVVGACGNRRKDPERPGAGNRALKRQLRTGTAPWFVVGASAPGPRSTRTFRQRSSAAGSRAPGAPGAEAPTTNSRIMVGMQAGPVERPVVADIGTGSGAIAVSLALALPHAVVYAVDISADALAVAAANAARLGVADRVRLLQGDLLAPLPEPADLIVANLPYIPAGDLPALQLEVRAYEPVLALADGPTGLDLIARLLAQAPGHLRPGGALALEVGAGQANGVGTLAAQHLPGAAISTVRDLAGHERVVVVRRCETSCQRILGTD